MGKNDSKGPSRPYRGGHTGKGGSHEKGGCLAVIVGVVVLGGGAVLAATETVRTLI